ncbi:MAG TPA: hypothetical protein VF029_03605 [Actinomycetota bacterium]
MIFRRRRLPDRLLEPFRAFEAIVPRLERAKAALTESVPGTRLPGRPLAETLLEFEEGLRAVHEGMAAWRVPELEAEWDAAQRGLRESARLAERLRVEAPDPGGFEGLIGVIGDLIAPLEAFGTAAERFRDLRLRPS